MGRWCNSAKQDKEIDEKVKTFLRHRYWPYLLIGATYMSDGRSTHQRSRRPRCCYNTHWDTILLGRMRKTVYGK
jgi:hypothetical protein